MTVQTLTKSNISAVTSRISEVDFDHLEFGKHISDHMTLAEYADGKWSNFSLLPYGDLQLNPAMLALHYGQSVFEGIKAFKMDDGRINIFRPDRHCQRLNQSLERMCMPPIPPALFHEALHALVAADKQWVPPAEGASLYLRPLVFATENRLGVKISDKYLFIILASPVGPYQSRPYRLKVEDWFVRTAEGGTGAAKCAGNYGAAFHPTQVAQAEGFDQILWTDHKSHEYIDEVGMMNVMFVINDALVTPQLTSAILDGVTRDSILTLAKEMGMRIEERKVSVAEVEQAFKNNTLQEAFGTGTAAVVAPIAVIHIHGTDYVVPEIQKDSFQLKVKERLNNIRLGRAEDVYHWNDIV